MYRLFGYAGTGKTTLASYLAEGVSGQVQFAAYTGKAAHVLQTKGCPSARTLHSLIYNPKDKSKERLRELEGRLEATDPKDAGRCAKLQRMINEESANLCRPSFTKNLDSDLLEASLLVVDECSMVDKRMGSDILSFGKKVLVLGDPAQLPPVMGGGFFTNQEPDTMLTDIRRQAIDNPIIWMSKEIREKNIPPFGDYGDSRIISSIDPEEAKESDQVLVGRNSTRYKTNHRLRELLGLPEGMPVSGDRLVCLRNESEYGLINGAIWYVIETGEQYDDLIDLTLQAEDTENVITVAAHTQYFEGRSPNAWTRRDAQEFDYGYALTVHKSQGSQWDNVTLIDESTVFRQDWWRWLYTGVTRGAERIDLVRRSA